MQLYNTLTRQKDELQPLHGKTVKLYTCGLTVYGQPHIGNWVGYIYWDVLERTLGNAGFNVERTQNITDVGHLTSDDDDGDDKMVKGAKREGLTAWDIADKYISIADQEAYNLLKLKRPTHLVRATTLIKEQISFVSDLEAKGYTYTIPQDGIYFDTSKLSDYGKLARLDIDGLQAGARVPVDGKKNITDFALWKFSHEGQQRDMEWESPWGTGFPGWHLECSVIARETLGEQIDIHTGGIDHIPVHHTNEIAQTETLTGKPFSQLWVHNNHIKVNGTKMSKSLGNIYTLADITAKGFDVTAFKLLVLSKHYRTEGNFTWEIIESSQNRLDHWRSVAVLRHQTNTQISTEPLTFDTEMTAITASLLDDLNTPEALAQIDKSLGNVQVPISLENSTNLENFLNNIDYQLGLDLIASTPDVNDEAKELLIQRSQARSNKNWQLSDELRDKLTQKGIGVKDSVDSQIWTYLK